MSRHQVCAVGVVARQLTPGRVQECHARDRDACQCGGGLKARKRTTESCEQHTDEPPRPDTSEHQTREVDAGDVAMQRQVAASRKDVQQRTERWPAEVEHEAERPCRDESTGTHVTAHPCDARDEADSHEQAHDGEAAAVVQLAGEEPAEHLWRPVRVEVEGALVELEVARPRHLAEQWNQHPGGDEQRASADDHGADETLPQLRRVNDYPGSENQQRQVPGQEMTGDGEGDGEGGQCVVPAMGDSTPAETPCQREEPHAPQLRPETEPTPRVAAVLIAISRGADEER